jgi:hypothetical protein
VFERQKPFKVFDVLGVRHRFEQAAPIGIGLELIRLGRGDQAVKGGTRLYMHLTKRK